MGTPVTDVKLQLLAMVCYIDYMRPSNFLNTLYSAFKRLAHYEGLGNEIAKLADDDVVLIKCLLKGAYLNSSVLTEQVKAKDYLNKLNSLKEATASIKNFHKLSECTIFLYRKHEDDVRQFDFLNKASQNELSEDKIDRRTLEARELQQVAADEILEKMYFAAQDGSLVVNQYELLNPKLDYDTVKRRVAKLAQTIGAVTDFYSEYYNNLSDATDPDSLTTVVETKAELYRLTREVLGATEINTKSHKELDVFIHILFQNLKKNNSDLAAKDKLDAINQLLHLGKNFSDENLRTIATNAIRAIEAEPKYKQLYSELVELS